MQRLFTNRANSVSSVWLCTLFDEDQLYVKNTLTEYSNNTEKNEFVKKKNISIRAMLVKNTLKNTSSSQRPTLESVKRRLFHDDDSLEHPSKRVRYSDITT